MGTEILAQEGFEVLGVTDGRQALESLNRFAPDLVLADVAMPEHSGYEICEQIKGNPALGHVKVILLVGAVDPFDRTEAQRVGADGMLRKPFEPSVMVETIRPLLASTPPRPPPPEDPERFEQAVRAALEDDRVDRERVRAAVVLAVESALPAFLDELTERVVEALRRGKP